MILLAIFCPPLYFLLQKKWGMFILTSGMAFLAAIFAIMVVLLPGTFILWFIALFMAVQHYKRQNMEAQMKKHAEMVCKEVAANLARNDKI
jgi:uncharacterized membrane protein